MCSRVFDKPDALDGPFFEETLYVTPTPRGDAVTGAGDCRGDAGGAAAGLWHGPVHAECRVAMTAPWSSSKRRPGRLAGLCARALRFEGAAGEAASLEALLLRAAMGESLIGWRRRPAAAGVLMVPIPSSGVLREVRGVEAARQVPHVTDVVVTAKPGQRLDALPEGADLSGLRLRRRRPTADAVEAALRQAQAALERRHRRRHRRRDAR